MFAATAGVNTHKGAVFALGLLAAAAGRLEGRGDTATVDALCAECAAMTAHLVADELRRPLAARTAGERLFQRHGMTGARGEAASGFATARRHALPAFRRARAAGLSTPFALHAAFLELLAENADTNLVSRGGIEGLEFVRAEARALRAAGGIARADFLPRMEALDDELNRRNLSPGGSADLLSVTWFLSHFAEEKNPASSQAAGSTEGGGEQT
jgi:triphosphoribosyl-dephospho-CoA synthase